MKSKLWIRTLAVLVTIGALFGQPESISAADWPRCDTGGAGATTCTGEIPGGVCTITCSVGSACCSIYDGCNCLYDM